MYVVTITSNFKEDDGKAYICTNRKEGEKKIKELYWNILDETYPLNETETYIQKGFNYAQVSDGLLVTELRLIETT